MIVSIGSNSNHIAPREKHVRLNYHAYNKKQNEPSIDCQVNIPHAPQQAAAVTKA